jgi:hypothetical protein
MTYAFSLGTLSAQHEDFAANMGQSTAHMCGFFALPRRRATRACSEFAAMYRALSDVAKINTSYGTVYDLNGQPRPLVLRQLTNKIIHADKIEWVFDNPDEPLIVCHASRDGHATTRPERAASTTSARMPSTREVSTNSNIGPGKSGCSRGPTQPYHSQEAGEQPTS